MGVYCNWLKYTVMGCMSWGGIVMGHHGLECTVMGCGRKHNGLMGKVSLNTEHRTHGAQKGKSSFWDFYQIPSGFHRLSSNKYN